MSRSLPYSRKRRYLTGIDWLIGAMAHDAKRKNGVGVFSQSVLEVEGTISEQQLRQALDQISAAIRLIHGRPARDWLNLAPYWKGPANALNARISLRVVDLPVEQFDQADQLLDEHAAAAFESESEHLRFLLVRIGATRSRLGMVFDHRLLDAFSAEAFFRLLDETWQGHLDQIAPRVKQTEPAHLDHWIRRLKSGRTLNRLLIRLGRQPVCGLTLPPGSPGPIRFVRDQLSVEESKQFIRGAGDEIGVPIILPSAMARAVDAMREVFPEMPAADSQYLIFTSANMRAPGQDWQDFLFNHFSLLPFSIATQAPFSVRQTALAFRDQFFGLMKQKIPFVMQEAAALGRICPHWIGSRLLRLVARGRICSFYFVCLREPGFTGETFMGLPTINLVHKPLVFSPPALNICMTYFHDRFNLVISYADGAIEPSTARRLLRQFKASLTR